ncbi:M23 family metallopeptidase [Pseudogemmobacter bohemicus]|uniref:M23 family metallopeptidase n=1 Tax=Pseudogemmobacter bohemicus TaxID=2250708 RepID=UPI000DD3A386|nr:M23 family metallopeptidase [Pseudogemmobacter bohemicus]
MPRSQFAILALVALATTAANAEIPATRPMPSPLADMAADSVADAGSSIAEPRAAAMAGLTGDTVIEHGESLDRVLSRLGIRPEVRAEIAMAFEDVYDLGDLRPGDVLNWKISREDPGRLASLRLQVSGGVEIELSFAGGIEANRIDPTMITRERNEVLVLDGTLYDALLARNAPGRFAVDLVALMAGQVDFRRDIKGGETFALVWQEDALPDGTIAGEPRLSYARLTIGENIYELVSSDPASPIILFENGTAVQRSAPPIMGARLSSVFGNRKHPVLGGQRMHTGIDFAAPIGTPVNATGAGRVVFTGSIRGYGTTVDIDHGGGVITRYAHLSKISDALRKGSRVSAGDQIGAVGATGLVSGPNLHYEVRVDGRPVDPMQDEVMPEQETASPADLALLETGRARTGFDQADRDG